MEERIIEKFLKNSNENVCTLNDSSGEPYYILTKVDLDDRFCYVFQGYKDINVFKSVLTIIGVYDKKTNKLYVSSSYIIDKYVPDDMLGNIYELTVEIENNVDKAFKQYINDHKEEFKNIGSELYDEYVSYKENYEQIKYRAKELYTHNQDKEDTEFSIYGKADSNYYDYQRISTEELLEYLRDSKKFIQDKIDEYLNRDVTLHSSVCGVPNINTVEKYYIGYRLIEDEVINSIIQELSKDLSSFATKQRNIAKAVEDETMKTVNVTVVNNGEELTFKQPADVLRRLDISEYRIPDTYTRNKFSKLFGDKYYYTNELLARVVKITYGKTVIYEGEDLSKLVSSR